MTNPYRAMCAELLSKIDYTWGDIPVDVRDLMDRARALLAQPVAEAPTGKEIMELMPQQMRDDLAAAARALAGPGRFRPAAGAIRIILNRHAVGHARAALAKWGTLTPQPVAVSERLPGPEDCLDEGWAWFFNQRIGWRQAVLPVSPGYTHWLPANALPTPEA
jgi:hypothetical protein